MNSFYKHIGYVLVVCMIFYIIGSLFPVSIFSFSIDETVKTSKGESIYYLICLFQVILMVITALLAIFGDHIRQRLRHPLLNAKLRTGDIREELTDPNAQQKEAKRYYNILDIYNTGKQNASDCELILEKISYHKGNDSVELLLDEIEINFIGGKNYISVNGKKSIMLYELFAAGEQGQTKGEKSRPVPQMNICGVAIPPRYSNGEIEISLRLNTISTSSMLINVKLTWDGVWENRSVDMTKHFTNTVL